MPVPVPSPPNAYGYGPAHASGSPTRPTPLRNGTMSNALTRTPTSSPGTAARTPSMTSRTNRVRPSKLPP